MKKHQYVALTALAVLALYLITDNFYFVIISLVMGISSFFIKD